MMLQVFAYTGKQTHAETSPHRADLTMPVVADKQRKEHLHVWADTQHDNGREAYGKDWASLLGGT